MPKPFCTFYDEGWNVVHFKMFGEGLFSEPADDVPGTFVAHPDHYYYPSDQIKLQGYCGAYLQQRYENDFQKHLGNLLGDKAVHQRLITFEEVKNLLLLEILAE